MSTRVTTLKKLAGACDYCKPTAQIRPEEAVELMRTVGMEPLEPYPGARKPWRARCTTCGTVGGPQLGNIRQGQGPCVACGESGFDVRRPTTLYVLFHDEFAAIKVGITNSDSKRIKNMKRLGFRVARIYEFQEGSEPLRIETLLLRQIRANGFRQAMTQGQMGRHRGATETFPREDVSTRWIYDKIRRLQAS